MIWNRELKQWEYDFSDPKEKDICLQVWLGSREYAVELLSKSKGWEQCNDEVFTYYATVVGGHRLMYRRSSYRTDGRKMYRLTDELARLLMFDDLENMKYTLQSIQYWRGWVSTERLNEALKRYVDKVKNL